MDFNIEKIKETDEDILFSVSIPEAELQKDRYGFYLRGRKRLITSDNPRPSFEEFERHYQPVEHSSKLNGAVFYKHVLEIEEKIGEEMGLSRNIPVYLDRYPKEGSNSVATFKFLKTPQLNYDEVMDFLPLVGFDKSSIPDFTDEIDAEIESLRKQNVRLIPIEESEDLEGTLNISLVAKDGEDEVEVANMNIKPQKLFTDYGIDVRDKTIKTGDEFDIEDAVIAAYRGEAGEKSILRINQVYQEEFPDLDDDFAAEVSEYDTLDELRQSLEHEKYLEAYAQGIGSIFNDFFASYLRDQESDFPEEISTISSLYNSDLGEFLSYQANSVSDLLLVPFLKDGKVIAHHNLLWHMQNDFIKYILDSEIGAAIDKAEEELESEYRIILGDKYSQQYPGLTEDEIVANNFPIYKASYAIDKYLEDQGLE